MQRLGTNFIIKKSTQALIDGQTYVACLLSDGSWVLGMGETAQYVTSLEQVSMFGQEIQDQVKAWLAACQSNPALVLKAKPHTEAKVNVKSELSRIVDALPPETQAAMLNLLKDTLFEAGDSLAVAAQPQPNSGQDGYGQESFVPAPDADLPDDLDPELRDSLMASGLAVERDPVTGGLRVKASKSVDSQPLIVVDEHGRVHGDTVDPEEQQATALERRVEAAAEAVS